MPKKVRDMIKEVEADGWIFSHAEGDHRQYKHPTKRGKVTIPGHPRDDLGDRIVASIRRQMRGT